ncbi:hypothetical protein EVJ20_13495 [Exiguobacterium sp. SH0S1]|uniref:hypothetical protein n=1 Tax=Exiguobacterium sp. SH0S1 TaxID=2510949 RepID=UPI00103920C3|nr:hypothetical protein [Exiguobacterium sp. SH0S1]TCI75697.1 hypothetical protein EVJ20_13495 [Exiguobacterium sp. SH0S1]
MDIKIQMISLLDFGSHQINRGGNCKMIYYPHFEIRDEKWLKFALLYYKEINPIIPSNVKIDFTAPFKAVYEDTDLIQSYNPSYDDGKNASFKAIDTITRLLTNRKYYSPTFGTNDIELEWSNNKTHTYEIYNEKFASEWIYFCKERNMGTISDNGIKTNPDLAFIYMSIFANNIADNKNVSTITDDSNYDNFLRATYTSQSIDQSKLFIADRLINFMIPQDLDGIPLSKIISIRNSDSFENKISAFHTTLEKYVLAHDSNLSAADYLDSLEYDTTLNDLTSELRSHKLDLVHCGVTIWSMFNSNDFTLPLAVSSIIPVVQASQSIHNTRKINEPFKTSKKFLADLRKI